MGLYQGRVIKNEEIHKDAYIMEIDCPQIAEKAVPGQFIHIRVTASDSPLLRRPISIFDVSFPNIYIYYKVVGKGTEILAKTYPLKELSLIGPLGKGFELTEKKKVFVVGGGMGIAPLLFLTKELQKKNNEITVFLGASTKEALKVKDTFKKYANKFKIATDDGSIGFKGTVVDLVKKYIEEEKPQIIYTCGPKVVLREIKKLSQKEKIPCQVSLEERMACGIGACLGCTCKGKSALYFPKVCTDGPVFWAEEVDLDD